MGDWVWHKGSERLGSANRSRSLSCDSAWKVLLKGFGDSIRANAGYRMRRRNSIGSPSANTAIVAGSGVMMVNSMPSL